MMLTRARRKNVSTGCPASSAKIQSMKRGTPDTALMAKEARKRLMKVEVAVGEMTPSKYASLIAL